MPSVDVHISDLKEVGKAAVNVSANVVQAGREVGKALAATADRFIDAMVKMGALAAAASIVYSVAGLFRPPAFVVVRNSGGHFSIGAAEAALATATQNSLSKRTLVLFTLWVSTLLLGLIRERNLRKEMDRKIESVRASGLSEISKILEDRTNTLKRKGGTETKLEVAEQTIEDLDWKEAATLAAAVATVTATNAASKENATEEPLLNTNADE